MMPSIIVASPSPSDITFAKIQAQQFGLSFIENSDELCNYPAYLFCENASLYLCFADKSLKPMQINFADSEYQKRLSGIKQNILVRACGLDKKAMTIIDATAGFGYDSWVLAKAGAKVALIEQAPFISCLLNQAIEAIQGLSIASSLSLHQGNALELIPILAQQTKSEVIYLDPMFPESQKSAATKKPMQILQNLLPPQPDETTCDLFDIAREWASDRVVLKRPLHAPFLRKLKPNHSIAGKLCRFDVYKKGQ